MDYSSSYFIRLKRYLAEDIAGLLYCWEAPLQETTHTQSLTLTIVLNVLTMKVTSYNSFVFLSLKTNLSLMHPPLFHTWLSLIQGPCKFQTQCALFTCLNVLHFVQ